MKGNTGLKNIPPAIWALGVASLFNDIASEMIFSVLPLFITNVLGVSISSIGMLEGIAEGLGLVVKIISGVASDITKKRKPITVIGYLLSAASKFLFPLAHTFSTVIGARFIDRIGKGIRDTPRDALISEIAPPATRGACFGLRQALDTVGAILGPAIAALCLATIIDIRTILWVATVPTCIAVIILLVDVREPDDGYAPPRTALTLQFYQQLPKSYWRLIVPVTVLYAAHCSQAFIILQAQHIGIPTAFIPLLIIIANIVYALWAYPIGARSDTVGTYRLVTIGIIALIGAHISFAYAQHWSLMLVGSVLWGLHSGYTKSLFATIVAQTTEPAIRATAYGILYASIGIATLCASVLMGYLWDTYSSKTAFLCAASITTLALALWLALQPSTEIQAVNIQE